MLSVKNIQWQKHKYNENIVQYIMYKYDLSFELSCLIIIRLKNIPKNIEIFASQNSNITSNESNKNLDKNYKQNPEPFLNNQTKNTPNKQVNNFTINKKILNKDQDTNTDANADTDTDANADTDAINLNSNNSPNNESINSNSPNNEFDAIDIRTLENFLNPKLQNLLINIYHLKDLKESIELTTRAIKNKLNICIYGDYDVDGASATSLLSLFFQDLGIKTNLYIPDRLNEGYGLNITAIDKIAAQGNQIIIAVDNGSTAFEEIKYANTKNIKTIILDHHITKETLPDCLIVNPNRFDQISPYKNLCATAVTWIFCIALRTAIEDFKYIPKAKLLEYIDIVALATICDVMDLHGINRFFVQYGIKIMNSPNKGNFGIKNLLNIINEKASVGTIGFKVGAMINAGSRLENSYLAVKLLTLEQSKFIANKLYNLNETRKNIENEIYQEAYQQALQYKEKNIIIISADNWHVGVIGIIASRIMEEFNKPCIIITYIENIGVGSCRSIKKINIGELIIQAHSKQLIITGGGHSMAAGFKIKKEKHQLFTHFIQEHTPQIKILDKKFDLQITASRLNLLLLQKLSTLEPYGTGNRNPLFLITDIKCKQIKILKDLHIMCILENNIRAFAFRSINNQIGHFLLSYAQDLKSNFKNRNIDNPNNSVINKNHKTSNSSPFHFNIIGNVNQFNGEISIIITDLIQISQSSTPY